MKYDNVRVGMNSRLDTIQAAILRVKLAAFAEHELDDVNERATWYEGLLGSTSYKTPSVLEGYLSSWAQYTVICPDGVDRDELQAALKSRGVPTNVYYPKPMHEQLAFAGGRLLLPCPVTERLCKEVLSLPMGPYLTQEDARQVADLLERLS